MKSESEVKQQEVRIVSVEGSCASEKNIELSGGGTEVRRTF